MPPRMASARQTTKRQQGQQQNQDRDSPATSVDVSVTNAKNGNLNRNVANGTTNGANASNSKKRAAPTTASEPSQANKRKKVEGSVGPTTNGAQDMSTTSNSRGSKPNGNQPNQVSSEQDEPKVAVDFSTLPASSIWTYLQKYDLTPPMYPSPHTQYIPALPPHLLNPPVPPPQAHTRTPSPHLGPQNSSRSKRDAKRSSTAGMSNRRSTRLAEDEFNQSIYGGVKERLGKPILHDLLDAQKVYSDLAKRHWDGIALKESETIEAFGFAIRNKGRLLKTVT